MMPGSRRRYSAPRPRLRGEDVHYVAGDEATRGYLAVPEGEGPFPALVLIHEWNGLVDRVRQVADAMADEGYVALAADLFQGRTGSNPDENMALIAEANADPDAVIANLNEAVNFLRARDDVTGAIGTMGWCFGGGIALSYALGGEHHDATAIFYGRLVTDPEVLAVIDHEVYGTFAEMDTGPPPGQVNQFVDALRAQGIENDVHIYDAVNHGFWLRVDDDPDLRTAPRTGCMGPAQGLPRAHARGLMLVRLRPARLLAGLSRSGPSAVGLALAVLLGARVEAQQAGPSNPFAGFETHFLSNGVKVWFKQLPGAPNVSVSVGVPVGSDADPPGKEQLAHFHRAHALLRP